MRHAKEHLHLSFFRIPSAPAIPERLHEYEKGLREISELRTGEYATHEHAIRLPKDTNILAEVKHMAERYWTTQLRYVFIVGIGGSALGAQAVYEALEKDGHDKKQPKLIFLDTVSTPIFRRVEELIDAEISYPEEVLIVLISKSGTTTESIANFEVLYHMMSERFLRLRRADIGSRIVVITDHGSSLWKEAERKGLGLLPIPKNVGGRFSVFSPVGLFPLALAGVDITELVAGGRDMLELSLGDERYAVRLAESVFRSVNNGFSILDLFIFDPVLESLGKWARQLYAESLGKEKDRSGRIVHAGITPIVSIGSTDLHSMAQLYLGGPKDKLTFFVRTVYSFSVKVPKGMFSKLVPDLEGKTSESIIDAIYGGVKTAYETHRLPFAEHVLSSVSPYTLGMFLELHIITVMLLGELLYVNAFDQPNVEDYKQATRALLKGTS